MASINKQKKSQMMTIFFVVSMLIAGTMNTLTTKMQLTSRSINKLGQEDVFAKPWFATFNMLLAMALVGVVDKIVRLVRPTETLSPDMEYAQLKEEQDDGQLSYRQKIMIVAIPAAFDLVATAFCCMGMLYVPASIWQMLKGGSIIFCGILSVTYLKRKLYVFHWLGLCCCVLGLFTVGTSSVLGSKEQPQTRSPAELLLGIGLVMCGQLVQAAQVIAEEYLMKDVDIPAMQIVGWEGIWGTLMMVLLVYPLLWVIPGNDHGHVEDAIDTLVMISNSGPLFWLVVVYLFSCGTFNAAGISVTGALSATQRQIMDASRTSVIWLFGLTVHYLIDENSPYGEAWTLYSYLELAGFLMLVAGQSIYGEFLKVPGLYYPPPSKIDQVMFASPGSLHVASPLPRED